MSVRCGRVCECEALERVCWCMGRGGEGGNISFGYWNKILPSIFDDSYNSAITGTIRLYFKTSPCSRFKEFD